VRPAAPLLAALLIAGCAVDDGDGDGAAPGGDRRDRDPDGLYRDFLDGKFDEAGHPLGARVWQAESDCAGDTGAAEAEGLAAAPGRDQPGALCRIDAGRPGLGRFTLNLRALTGAPSADTATALTVRVTDADGRELAVRDVPHAHFTDALIYQNVAVDLTVAADAALAVEVLWRDHPIRIDYLELFRAPRGVVIEPPSGLLADGADLLIEAIAPPPGHHLELSCTDGAAAPVELDAALAELLADGDADRTDTEFRSLITAPADRLLAGCPRPTRLLARVVADGRTRAAARVTNVDGPPACAFAPAGDRRVLLTGFEPFPADAGHDNSSERAVAGFDPAGLPGVSVMKLILPVEWRGAAAVVTDVVDRCRPDVVISFGQGRWAVDVETTAYNVMDSSDVAGGVPDNRGIVHGGTAIVDGGPAELATGLPAADLVARLSAAGIDAGASDDPGRYICNNVFYAAMTAARGRDLVAGFIHLPYLAEVDAGAAADLQLTVQTAIAAALGR
jgi:pyroglutamyl-peptidase